MRVVSLFDGMWCLQTSYNNCGVKDTHIYKAFGNGWTIDIIVYILSFMIKNRTEK